MDRLAAIELFNAIVETGSLTAAAERLGISRTMASRHLARLEARLGARLINRTTRRLALTEPGRLFHARCRQILSDLEEAEGEVASAALQPRGLLRVSAPMTFGAMHLATLVSGYLEAYREVSVDLVLDDRFVDLVEEGFDVAVRIGRLADSSLVVRRLATCRMVMCAAPAYLERMGRPETADELGRHVCLGYAYWSAGGSWELDGPEGRVAVRVGGRLRANNGEALAAAAAAGLGIVIQPSFIVARRLERGELVSVLPRYRVPERGIYAVFPEGRRVSAKVRTFVEWLARALRPEPPWDRAWRARAPGGGPAARDGDAAAAS